MNSWLIWQALQNAAYRYSPYWRILSSKRFKRIEGDVPVLSLMNFPAWFAHNTIAVTSTVVCAIFFVTVFFDATLLTWLCFLPLAVLLMGTFSGLIIAVRTSGTTAYEYERQRYDITAVTPEGHTGVSWAICSEVYHNSTILLQIRAFMQTVYPFFLLLGFILMGILFLVSGSFLVMMVAFLFTTAIYADYIQSSVAGCIVGMIIPTYVHDRISAQVLALGGFLGMQMLFYMIVALLGFVLVPLVLDQLILMPIAQFVIFFALREVWNRVLWRWLAWRLQSDILRMNAYFAEYADAHQKNMGRLQHPI